MHTTFLRLKLLIIFIVVLFCSGAHAFTMKPENFVKYFYDFYLNNKKPYPEKLISIQKFLDADLYQLLLDDNQKRLKDNKGSNNFLDFDPFLNSQDDPGPITKINLLQAISKPLIAVTFSIDKKPNLIIQLKAENNNWKIANVLYPAATLEKDKDLVSILKNYGK